MAVSNLPINIFFSYSHDDREYLRKIKQYLNSDIAPDIQLWDDKEIKAGEKWDAEIKKNIEKADIILLLVSISFLNSVKGF